MSSAGAARQPGPGHRPGAGQDPHPPPSKTTGVAAVCTCAEHRDALLAAARAAGALRTPDAALRRASLSRRDLLRLAAGVGAVAALPTGRGAWGEEAAELSWLAGDLHVHTTLSHDVWAGPGDDNTGQDQAYTLGWTPGEQIALAELRGLDFLALTDHNRTDVLRDPGWRSERLVLVPGYEHSLAGGHTGVFVPEAGDLPGVLTDDGEGGAGGTGFAGTDGLARFLAAVHDRDGVVVVNHPFYRRSSPSAPPTWRYDAAATAAGVDAVEVWNSVWANRSDVLGPHLSPYDDYAAAPWWEREVVARRRVPLVGGSDNHWRVLTGIAGVGQPTTWVLARDRSPGAVLEAVRRGRTTVSAQPPALGGARLDPLVVEDWRHGRTARVGGDVRALGPLVVQCRVTGGAGHTLRAVSAGRVVGSTVVAGPDVVTDLPVVLPPGGWVRLELFSSAGLAMTAMTSPVYAAGTAPAAVRRTPSTGPVATYEVP